MRNDRSAGPVMFAYDGSTQAREAIRQAGRQLRNGRRAIVLTVWEPFAALPFVGAPMVPPVGVGDGLKREAQRVADEGAGLARAAGFDAEPIAEQGDPIWQRIVDSAEEHGASIIAMGSHGRSGIELMLLGSVAAAVARHTARPILIAHDGSEEPS
ncbi:MAG: universal stress protein [Thermoleophilaceae bacterium]